MSTKFIYPGDSVGNYEFIGSVSASNRRYLQLFRNIETRELRRMRAISSSLEPNNKLISLYEKIMGHKNGNLLIPETMIEIDWNDYRGNFKATLVFEEFVIPSRELYAYELQNLEEAVNIMLGFCNGNGFLHSLNIIHNDIKQDNLLMSSNSRAILIDYSNISEPFEKPSGNYGDRMLHWSPELREGGKISFESDVYQLALEFESCLLNQLRKGHVEVPEKLTKVIEMGQLKNPKERYRNAHELGEAIEKAMQDG